MVTTICNKRSAAKHVAMASHDSPGEAPPTATFGRSISSLPSSRSGRLSHTGAETRIDKPTLPESPSK